MTKPIVQDTAHADLTGLRRVVQDTALFPPDMLAGMLAPAFEGDASVFSLTCQFDGAAVGLCFARAEEMADGVWNMLALGVLPTCQGQGCGKALVRAAENRLRTKGARLLIVDTSGTDAFRDARAFYARLGYGEGARIRDYWASGDDKVTFRKLL